MSLLSGFRDGLVFCFEDVLPTSGCLHLCSQAASGLRQVPYPVGLLSRRWQIQALIDYTEELGIDLNSSLETPLALPLLRANDA